MAFEMSLRKRNVGQKSILFMGASIWNKLSNGFEFLSPTTSFTRSYKKLVLKNLSK